MYFSRGDVDVAAGNPHLEPFHVGGLYDGVVVVDHLTVAVLSDRETDDARLVQHLLQARSPLTLHVAVDVLVGGQEPRETGHNALFGDGRPDKRILQVNVRDAGPHQAH